MDLANIIVLTLAFINVTQLYCHVLFFMPAVHCRYMDLENVIVLTLAFIINVFVVCVFAKVGKDRKLPRETGEADRDCGGWGKLGWRWGLGVWRREGGVRVQGE